MNRQEMDQKTQHILGRVRRRIVGGAFPSLQSMAHMEDLIYGEMSRCGPGIRQA